MKNFVVSFLKDLFISLWSPELVTPPISKQMIKKVEKSALNTSWIPFNNYEKMMADHTRRLKSMAGVKYSATAEG